MLSTALQMTLIVATVIVGAALVGYLGFKIARSNRDLGTDADKATFETLHQVSVAAPHLAQGLTPEGAAKAGKHLRALLACQALVITDNAAVLAVDGTIPDIEGRGTAPALGLAAAAMAARRTQVKRSEGADLVCSPIMVGDTPVGTVCAYIPRAGAGFVRAVTEVAAWVAAQVGLAELDASRALLMEAEVRALRAQISPHFIYNSLNAIASFINTDPARARELVVEFADFTRYSFRRHGDFTTLAEELQAIDRYLLLEKARFGERIRVSLAIAPEVLSTAIPFLSLQPLVENAVRHGLESKPGGGKITLTASDSGEFALITVEDDGVGIDPGSLAAVLAGTTESVHVGLRNVDVRLRQVYGDAHGLVIDTAPGAGTLITMRIPKFRPGVVPDAPNNAPDGAWNTPNGPRGPLAG
ncbi:sensor histidine kinase [Paeniglutamicibacter kerguelensis]|uniref:Two-component system LytT family sensor kinase n=1 Tax=Paeniglutamicibacter kerguelensis TaxID=254788 RepID=A0ABS4X9X5_9MICC|nr:sensor histidine kinase [Paeniglutamicibacter kerguelensis]MBP2385106.1 two-component system LytT family sensor kinase [Paeniglutamicibacter kerguelensis]